MKKALMVSCDGLGNGGVQHVMMNIVRNLSNEFHFDMLLFTNEVRYFDAEFQKYGTIFRLPHKGAVGSFRRKIDFYIRFPRIYHGVKKILKEHGPYQVIHCHNYFEAAPCLLAAAHCGVPVRISHCHSVLPRFNFIARSLCLMYRKLLNRYATVKLGCSQAATNYLFGKNQGKSFPNAIDLNRFDINRYPAKKIKHSFVHVGSFGITKNQLFILDVFNVVQKQWPDVSLKLVGNKNEAYEALMQQKIKDLRIRNVQLLPHDSDVPALFAQSEYMIFPSTYEGFGLALVEAQAMGVKCFASDVIPKESNIGLCQYLSLKQSPAQWAKVVFESENTPLPRPNTQKVSLENYVRQILWIYEDKK